MNRHLVASISGAGLVGALVLTVGDTGGPRGQGPVYTVAQVEAELAGQPERWLGRTVRLRAIADPCPMWGSPSMGLHCLNAQPVLVDQEGSRADSLPLTWRQQGALLASLRGVPLLGKLVPAPQVLGWEARATYRVRLRAAPATNCGYLRCYEAVLLDAAPGSP